jgi:hypothetical protein
MNEPNYDPSYYEANKIRTPFTKFVALVVLALEMGVALLSLVTFDGFEECCGESIFYNAAEERIRWEQAFFWTSVAYLIIVIMQVPFVAKGYSVTLFNPVLGFALTLLTMYNLHPKEAWIMFGLETAAALTESFGLFRDGNFTMLFVQMLWGIGACGVTLFCFISLSQQGGYCIVDGTLESVFQESTCNTSCDGVEISCIVCDVDQPSCFIQI